MKTFVLFVRGVQRSTEARVVVFMAIQAATASLFALLTARWLGPSSRGSIVVFMTTASFLMLVGSLGICTGSRVLLNGSPPLGIADYLGNARLLTAVHLVTSCTLGLFTLSKTGGMPTVWVGAIFVPFSAVQLFNYFQREALHGIGLHGRSLLGDLLSSILQTVAVLLLKELGRLSLVAVCIAVLGGALAQAVYLSAQLRSTSQSPPFAVYSLSRLFRFSLPALISTLGQAFVIRGDRLILGMIAGTVPVGIYGTAATFTEMLWLLPGGVAQVAFRRASAGGSADARARTRRVTLSITVVACVALAAGTNFLVTYFLGAEYSNAVGLAYVLIAASLPMASYQLDVAVLNGLGRLSAGGRSTTVGAAILIGGCLLTIPRFGAFGAAWSSMAAYSAMALMARLQLRHYAVRGKSAEGAS